MVSKIFTGASAKLGAAMFGSAAVLALATVGGANTAMAADTDPAIIDEGRQIFTDWSCGACHVLKDAGGMGHVGPSLDSNANMSKDYIINRVTNGQGAMPGFGGQLTDEEIEILAEYISAASAE